MRRPKQSHKRFKALLKSEPDICIVKTERGARKIHKSLFPQLFHLGAKAVMRLSDRVAQVCPGFTLIETEHGEWYFQREDDGIRTPSIRTNSSTMLDYAKYDVSGLPSALLKEKRAHVLLEREREFVKQYGLFLSFAKV